MCIKIQWYSLKSCKTHEKIEVNTQYSTIYSPNIAIYYLNVHQNTLAWQIANINIRNLSLLLHYTPYAREMRNEQIHTRCFNVGLQTELLNFALVSLILRQNLKVHYV